MSEVKLSRNVVIDGSTHAAGSTVEVDADRKKELKALGVLDDGKSLDPAVDDAKAQVEAAEKQAAAIVEKAQKEAQELVAKVKSGK